MIVKQLLQWFYSHMIFVFNLLNAYAQLCLGIYTIVKTYDCGIIPIWLAAYVKFFAATAGYFYGLISSVLSKQATGKNSSFLCSVLYSVISFWNKTIALFACASYIYEEEVYLYWIVRDMHHTKIIRVVNFVLIQTSVSVDFFYSTYISSSYYFFEFIFQI
jgi:hypothetical protein